MRLTNGRRRSSEHLDGLNGRDSWRPSRRRGGPPPPPDPLSVRPSAPPSPSVRGPGGAGSGPHLTDLRRLAGPLRRALHSAHRNDATPRPDDATPGRTPGHVAGARKGVFTAYVRGSRRSSSIRPAGTSMLRDGRSKWKGHPATLTSPVGACVGALNPLLGGSGRSQGGPRWVSVVSEAHDQGPQPVPRYLDRLNGRDSPMPIASPPVPYLRPTHSCAMRGRGLLVSNPHSNKIAAERGGVTMWILLCGF